MAVLVFAGVFALLIGGLTSFIFVQNRLQVAKEHRESALQIAEAGLNYYRWFLAHNPEDITNGTGEPGPYTIPYNDPEAGQVGTATLTIDGNEQCGQITSIDISSEGHTLQKPEYARTVLGRYARPSVAEFAYIIDASVWAGADRDIRGRYHANGGIRMDGTNQSTVTSAVSTWQCTGSFGCNPTQTQPGVFGAGTGSELWEFPVPQIDFVGLTSDLVAMKTRAQTNGVYIGPSNDDGYRMVLRNNGTFDLYRVRNTSYAWSIHIDDLSTWQRDYHTITSQTFLANYELPDDCGLVFIEDKVWLEGVVSGKITIVAANVIDANNDPDLILNNNITYSNYDGSDGLTAIGEHSVLIPLVVPSSMELHGVFIAQRGYFGRNLYRCQYAPYDKRTLLSVTGSIVSSERVGTKWSYSYSGCGSTWSGFDTRENAYDRKLATDPPPLTPYVSDEYRFVEWREENN